MKKCIICSDSFKGTLSSIEICDIAERVIHSAFPDCSVISIPVADGGEGTVDCFLKAIGGKTEKIEVTGPLHEKVTARYMRKGNAAVIEMASAAGLPLTGDRKNPAITTTFGVGQLIKHAVNSGCKDILLGLGGSATNDGGCGCAAALGTKFFNSSNEEFIPVGGTLKDISRIDNSETEKLLKEISITVMCDVDNPLFGQRGAAYIFAPQKGADEKMVKVLDEGLKHFADIINTDLHINISDTPGSGAAGGMGAGCIAFFNAELKSGIEAVLDLTEFNSHLKGTDLVITGEGKLDDQSLHGKVISGIAQRTKTANIPLIAVVGSIDDSINDLSEIGISSIFETNRASLHFELLKGRAAADYEFTLKQIISLIKISE